MMITPRFREGFSGTPVFFYERMDPRMSDAALLRAEAARHARLVKKIHDPRVIRLLEDMRADLLAQANELEQEDATLRT
jgi:hypothetical protein